QTGCVSRASYSRAPLSGGKTVRHHRRLLRRSITLRAQRGKAARYRRTCANGCKGIASKLSNEQMTASGKRTLFLSHDRKRQPGELAETVADEHCPQGAVNPEIIAQAKHLTMSFGSYKDAFDGMLEHKAGRFHIYCNLDRVERRDSPRA